MHAARGDSLTPEIDRFAGKQAGNCTRFSLSQGMAAHWQPF